MKVLTCQIEPIDGICPIDQQVWLNVFPSLEEWHAFLPYAILILMTAWGFKLLVRQLLNTRG